MSGMILSLRPWVLLGKGIVYGVNINGSDGAVYSDPNLTLTLPGHALSVGHYAYIDTGGAGSPPPDGLYPVVAVSGDNVTFEVGAGYGTPTNAVVQWSITANSLAGFSISSSTLNSVKLSTGSYDGRTLLVEGMTVTRAATTLELTVVVDPGTRNPVAIYRFSGG